MSGKDSGVVGGVDLGATKILSLIVDESGKVLAEDLRPTEGATGPDAVIGHMVDSLRQAVVSAGGVRLAAIGVDAPGPIDYPRGIVTSPPNLPGWHDVPLASIIGKEFGLPCVLENDANAAALAEHRWGSGRGSQHMVFLTVSSGIGGGIIAKGELYRGASGAAGEVGHMTINMSGPRCHCGRRGCLEMYASGIAIARVAQQFIRRNPKSSLAKAVGKQPLTGKLVHDAADAGDKNAQEIIRAAGRALGVGLASLINVFNPQVIVLDGSLTKIGDLYLKPAFERARQESFEISWNDVRIVVGELGDRSAALGAAAVAMDSELQK
jgi:glucokinase